MATPLQLQSDRAVTCSGGDPEERAGGRGGRVVAVGRVDGAVTVDVGQVADERVGADGALGAARGGRLGGGRGGAGRRRDRGGGTGRGRGTGGGRGRAGDGGRGAGD